MAYKVAINGFGRIGRLTLRNLLKSRDIDVVAINDLTDNATLAHLFKYDTAHGIHPDKVSSTKDSIKIGRKTIKAYTERDPSKLPWKKLKVDIVLECTGIFRDKDKAGLHLKAGAKKVILSAPGKGDGIATIVLGVNDEMIKAKTKIYSNASCTTNCLAPVVKLIDQNWGIKQGNITTTHAYTAAQRIQDAPHSDLRRGRAAAMNIVPTSTGAAVATSLVYPSIKGKLTALSLRVPIITGSIIELIVWTDKKTTAAKVNAAFKKAAAKKLKGIVQYEDAPIVSSDIVGNTHSCIFDSLLTIADGNMLKVVGWYDNEAGYSARLADLTKRVAKAKK